MKTNMYCCLVFLPPFVLLLILQSTSAVDQHLDLVKQDFGPNGTQHNVFQELYSGMPPGSTIKIEARTFHRGTINICDENYNNLIQVDNRLYHGKMKLTSRLNNKFLDYEVEVPTPTKKGEMAVTTIMYTEDGFHVFVNGQTVAKYEHQFISPPKYVIAFNNIIHKLVYVAEKPEEPMPMLPNAQ